MWGNYGKFIFYIRNKKSETTLQIRGVVVVVVVVSFETGNKQKVLEVWKK